MLLLFSVININGNLMQIANPTTQATTAAAATPVQQITSPTAAATQAGNIVMVIKIKSLSLAQSV